MGIQTLGASREVAIYIGCGSNFGLNQIYFPLLQVTIKTKKIKIKLV